MIMRLKYHTKLGNTVSNTQVKCRLPIPLLLYQEYMVLRLPSEQSASRAPCYHSEPPTNALGDLRRALALPYQPSNRAGNVRGTLFDHAKDPRYHIYGNYTVCIY